MHEYTAKSKHTSQRCSWRKSGNKCKVMWAVVYFFFCLALFLSLSLSFLTMMWHYKCEPMSTWPSQGICWSWLNSCMRLKRVNLRIKSHSLLQASRWGKSGQGRTRLLFGKKIFVWFFFTSKWQCVVFLDAP